MFRDRKLTVTVDKVDRGQTPETPPDPEALEKKADMILRKLEKLGKKAFLGLCIYVVLDTNRQVAVARASYQQMR